VQLHIDIDIFPLRLVALFVVSLVSISAREAPLSIATQPTDLARLARCLLVGHGGFFSTAGGTARLVSPDRALGSGNVSRAPRVSRVCGDAARNVPSGAVARHSRQEGGFRCVVFLVCFFVVLFVIAVILPLVNHIQTVSIV
jgi:hypothetical protein